jgi:hypothetical protein
MPKDFKNYKSHPEDKTTSTGVVREEAMCIDGINYIINMIFLFISIIKA